MHEIILFAEDSSHEQIIGSILRRLADTLRVPINLKCLNATGGHGQVLKALQRFVKDINRYRALIPPLVVVAIDANCTGFNGRRKQVEEKCQGISFPIAHAIPDPHVERWLLVDSAAFKAALGVGCSAPDQKCERDRYKRALREAVQKAGVSPSLGGIEYADDIVGKMNLTHIPHPDTSLEQFLAPVRQHFRQWAQEEFP